MNMLEWQTQLDEPIHDFCLSKRFALAFGLFSDMIRQVSVIAEFHYDNQNTFFDKWVLIRNDVWMI